MNATIYQPTDHTTGEDNRPVDPMVERAQGAQRGIAKATELMLTTLANLPEWCVVDWVHLDDRGGVRITLSDASFVRMFAGQTVSVDEYGSCRVRGEVEFRGWIPKGLRPKCEIPETVTLPSWST